MQPALPSVDHQVVLALGHEVEPLLDELSVLLQPIGLSSQFGMAGLHPVELGPDIPRHSRQLVLAEGVGFLADTMMEKLFAPSTLRDRPDVAETARNIMLATPPEGAAAALRGMAARQDSLDVLPQISVPTLVICGEHDAISTVDEMRGIAQQIPGAEYIQIADAGHMSPLENPQEVDTAIRDFLRRAC